MYIRNNINKEEQKSRFCCGYMSVEATFIVTLTVFVFIFISYLAIYLYNRTVLFQDTYMLSFRASERMEEEEILDYIENNRDEQYGEKYFATKGVKTSWECKSDCVTILAQCITSSPFAYEFSMKNDKRWGSACETKAYVLDRTKFIRECRMGEVIIDRLGE